MYYTSAYMGFAICCFVVPRIAIDYMKQVPLSDHVFNDHFVWGLKGSGQFSTNTATLLAHNMDQGYANSWDFKWIWKLDIAPKVKIFL